MSERLVQRETAWRDGTVIPYARLHGWDVWFTWRSDHSPAGWPDLVLARVRRGSYRVLFRELKTDRGRLTKAQEHCLATLAVCGLDVAVWRPAMWEQICEELA